MRGLQRLETNLQVESISDSLWVSGFVRALVIELWSALECGSEDVRVVRPKPTPMDPVDRSCLKVRSTWVFGFYFSSSTVCLFM